MAFLDATGLRRSEVRDALVRDVLVDEEQVYVHVRRGKGGKERWVPVLPGREALVLQVVQGRAPDEHIFAQLPKHLDIHAYRRRYAQTYYQHLSGRPLPPGSGRLPRGAVDHEAVRVVSRALGHNREDVVLTYYLR
ncbi:tyrosine-type recombinase/integrase [Ktedonobacter racemifer]|uniref:tyrosine-type recombinase/integrase n=1 Tax=Ktedonobacter racemifer TaxID=363277 RepID=UPI002379D033|nr:tyrosine-type recombinase/integrase [Ktedonobacter racemifer]